MYNNYRNWTATNLFLVPGLGAKRLSLNEQGFENAYIKDEIKGIDYENAVYMLFRPPNQEGFRVFLEKERERKAKIIDEYDYDDGWTMVVYQYDGRWANDVRKLMKGRFSLVSKEFQESIPKTIRTGTTGIFKDKVTIQHEIFRKHPDLADYWQEELGLELNFREDEFWHFYAEREIFNETTLKKLI